MNVSGQSSNPRNSHLAQEWAVFNDDIWQKEKKKENFVKKKKKGENLE